MAATTVFWIGIGTGLGLLLMLGSALRNSVRQARTLQQHHCELAEQHAQVCRQRNSQADDLRELRSALRAERAHVEQLQRKNRLMTLLLDELQASLKSDGDESR